MAKDPFADRRGQTAPQFNAAANGAYTGGGRRPPSQRDGGSDDGKDKAISPEFNRAAAGKQQDHEPPKLPNPHHPPPRPQPGGPGLGGGSTYEANNRRSEADARPASTLAAGRGPTPAFNRAAAEPVAAAEKPQQRSMVDKIREDERRSANKGATEDKTPQKGELTRQFNSR